MQRFIGIYFSDDSSGKWCNNDNLTMMHRTRIGVSFVSVQHIRRKIENINLVFSWTS